MKSRELAIIIMVNPRQYQDIDLEDYRNHIKEYSNYEEFFRHYARGGDYYQADRSDINLHLKCREETGAVYWCVPTPGDGDPKWLTHVKVGYFSQGQNKITHRFVISDIRQWKDFSAEERVVEEKYMVGSRRYMWENPAYYGLGTENKGQAMIWVKIADIETLPKPLNFDNFVKALTDKGEHPKFIRSYCIVLG